ncbi:hypothetical protein C8R44DRAFT_428184 [Mycena epipterygia]|nr:hypothetical protein C8R44DRAFT_428184 [Mycena epipterygia]
MTVHTRLGRDGGADGRSLPSPTSSVVNGVLAGIVVAWELSHNHSESKWYKFKLRGWTSLVAAGLSPPVLNSLNTCLFNNSTLSTMTLHYTLALIFAASALAAPLEPVSKPSPSSSTSLSLPEPSGSAAQFTPDRPGRRFACADTSKWPNGAVPLLVNNGKNVTQDSCLRPPNANATSLTRNLTATLYQYDNSTALVSTSSVTRRTRPVDSFSTSVYLPMSWSRLEAPVIRLTTH